MFIFHLFFNIVFFASEGIPHDRGYPIYNELVHFKEKLLKENSKINNIEIYTPRKLKSMGYDYHVKEYEDTGYVTMNKNLQYIGFCAWRPLIILLELEKMKDGDILVCRDSNIKKYKDLYNYNNIFELSLHFLEQCNFDFFIPRQSEDLKTINYCKKDVIVELGNDHPFFYEYRMHWNNFLVIRKSNISIELLQEWLLACENENWINGNCHRENIKNTFRWLCPEQSILNVIIAKWILEKRNNIPKNYSPIICGRDFNNYSLATSYPHLRYINFKFNTRDNYSNILWLLWTGSNKMSELRRSCLNNIYRYSEGHINLVTKYNLSHYINKSFPLHEAYQYLSDVHKSDYLRCYLMHIYGGAYMDIKPMKFSIKKYSENLQDNKSIIGYNAWHKNCNNGIPSVCCFMYKPNTNFTNELMEKIHTYLDLKLELLKKYPAKHPRHDSKVSKFKNYSYPIGWSDITDKILRQVIIKYQDSIDKTFPCIQYSKYANYYQEDNMITYDQPVFKNDNELISNDNEVISNDNEVISNDNEVISNDNDNINSIYKYFSDSHSNTFLLHYSKRYNNYRFNTLEQALNASKNDIESGGVTYQDGYYTVRKSNKLSKTDKNTYSWVKLLN